MKLIIGFRVIYYISVRQRVCAKTMITINTINDRGMSCQAYSSTVSRSRSRSVLHSRPPAAQQLNKIRGCSLHMRANRDWQRNPQGPPKVSQRQGVPDRTVGIIWWRGRGSLVYFTGCVEGLFRYLQGRGSPRVGFACPQRNFRPMQMAHVVYLQIGPYSQLQPSTSSSQQVTPLRGPSTWDAHTALCQSDRKQVPLIWQSFEDEFELSKEVFQDTIK